MPNHYRDHVNLPYFIDSLMTWSTQAQLTVHRNLDYSSAQVKTIYYRFATSGNEDDRLAFYNLNNNTQLTLKGFRQFQSNEKTVVKSLLDLYEDVANIEFVESRNADTVFF